MPRLYKDMTRPVCLSAQRALGGQTPESLRAYSFDADMKKQEILLRAHFGEQPSEADLEEISVVETETMADFLFVVAETITTDVEIVPVGQPLSFLSGGMAYLREGEPGAVCS